MSEEAQNSQPEPMVESEDNETSLEMSSGMNIKDWNGIDILQSTCMCCGETGKTVFMLHKIPYFRELIISSFNCDECGEQNNSVTFGGEIQLQGCVYTLTVQDAADLDRQLIKSDSASLRIPELDFEIPPLTQKGEISTLEGFLRVAAKNLGENQEQRMSLAPEVGTRVADIIRSLLLMSSGSPSTLPFTIVLDDPAGNSFVQSFNAPKIDANIKVSHYTRSPEQDAALGLQLSKEQQQQMDLQAEGEASSSPSSSSTSSSSSSTGPSLQYRPDEETNYTALLNGFGGAPTVSSVPGASTTVVEDGETVQLGRNEIIRIPSPCPHCGEKGESMTAVTDIPHFKEIILMAFTCGVCGFRNSEVKGGGAVPTYGTQVTLTITSEEDMKRDVLKSDSAAVIIPEIELELGHGTLGGVFTTIEGLFKRLTSSLRDSNPFAVGDSNLLHHSEEGEIESRRSRFDSFMASLDRAASCQLLPLTLILRDPLGNSFISSRIGEEIAPDQDTGLQILDFERNYDENEEFGLNDINVDHYENEDETASHRPFSASDSSSLPPPIVLPDRLTHITKKGPDHPTPFAKGTYEKDITPYQGEGHSTSPAVLLTAESTTSSSTTSQEEGSYYSAPVGWSFAKPDELSNPYL